MEVSSYHKVHWKKPSPWNCQFRDNLRNNRNICCSEATQFILDFYQHKGFDILQSAKWIKQFSETGLSEIHNNILAWTVEPNKWFFSLSLLLVYFLFPSVGFSNGSENSKVSAWGGLTAWLLWCWRNLNHQTPQDSTGSKSQREADAGFWLLVKVASTAIAHWTLEGKLGDFFFF